jgi:DNA-binding NarL/FixJ family response regulator
MAEKIRVVVIDDNHQRVESLCMLVESDPRLLLVASYHDGTEVEAHMLESQPDVVLMDIEMPNVDGIEAVRRIKAAYPHIKILMQTVFEDDEKIFDAISSGASGYILKRTEPSKVIDAIVEVFEGGSPITPSVATRILALYRSQQQSGDVEQFDLSEREKEVLQYLAGGHSYKMIAAACNISYHTVNAHIKKIYEKLHVRSVGEAVNLALSKKLVTPILPKD